MLSNIHLLIYLLTYLLVWRRQNHRNATASSDDVRLWPKRCAFSFCLKVLSHRLSVVHESIPSKQYLYAHDTIQSLILYLPETFFWNCPDKNEDTFGDIFPSTCCQYLTALEYYQNILCSSSSSALRQLAARVPLSLWYHALWSSNAVLSIGLPLTNHVML